MSETLVNNLTGLSGLLLGVLCIIIIYFINRRVGRNKRLFDERQQYVTARSKAAAWNATSVILLAAWAFIIIFDGISFSFFLMTGIWVAHNLSLIVTSVYFSNQN
ncbi:DUF2178 domain-containing protein [Bacillus sp. PK3_68]|uniref:DUF2178 domain-containing protein n=1 Tax=Bacillus sp. PK3_68 TaxID=2027408 RepID=UPI000E726EF8|nr:DUF2178 domain-containing protein [Bacillus sp. PK3_68]RJS59969.1 DUF2178 domain-containing protein [Bacillus sp. PK3_68]